jgi:lipopolysaccharide/colanic/teichoic acid biosynthesis glycosyltransferase
MQVLTPTSRNGRKVSLSLWDLAWALVTPILALYLRDIDILLRPEWSAIAYYWVLSSGFALLAFFVLRIHDGITRYFSVHQALDIAEAVLFAELMTCAAMFTLTRLDGIPRSMPLLHGLLLVGGLVAARLVVRIVFSSDAGDAQDFETRRERIILIGANPFASSFIQLLRAYAPQRQPVIAVLDDNASMVGRALAGVQVLGAPHELDSVISEFTIHGIATDKVVIAGEVDSLSPAVLREVERICQKRQIELSFLPRMMGVTEWKVPQPQVVANRVAEAPSYFRLKRGIDIVASLVMLIAFFPLLMIAGLLVVLDIGTPVLFWQERQGWKRRSFLMYKFRTLSAPFDSDGNPAIGREPSAIGQLLRATRLDELPQLLNVLLGDMSLIGPRPLLPEDQPENTTVRLSVRPGITGWAQVNGAKLVTKDEKGKLDEWYIQNASLWLDIRILWMTATMMLKSRLGSRETVADLAQVQRKDIGLDTTLPVVLQHDRAA